MTILYQTTFPTDEDPVGSPFAIKEGGLKVDGGLLQLVAQNSFSVIYDNGRSYPADHISEIVIDTKDNGDFGPAVCVSPSGLYFPINVNGSDIWLYKREGSFLQIGQWVGVNYPTTGGSKVGIRTVLNGDGTRTFTLLINGVATGTDIVDDPAVTGTPALSGGKPGVSGYSGVWRVAEFIGSDTNVSTGPTVTGVDDTTPEQGSTLVITGTDFLATQGTGGVVIGGAAQVETAWSNTSISVTLDRGANKYGVSVNIVVTDNAAASSSPFALSSLQPQAGWAYVNIGTPATSGLRITAVGDLASGDQLAYDTVGGTVTVFADGTFSVSGSTTEFDCELWTPGDGWGAIGTQSLTTTIAAAAVAVSSATAALSSGIRLAGAAAGTSSASAALNTSVRVVAAAVGLARSSAALTTVAAGLGAVAVGTSAATASLTAGVRLAAVAAGVSRGAAAISAGIALSSSAAGVARSSASLTTIVRLAAAARGTATATGALGTGVSLSASASGVARATASLSTTPQGFQAAAAGTAAATATLSTAVRMQAAASGTALATASLTTQPQAFAAAAVGTARASASLTTGTTMQAAATASASAAAAMTTAVRLLASAQGVATASASLSTAAAAWAAAAVARAQAAASLTTAIALQAIAKGSATASADSSSQVLVPNPGRTFYIEREARVLAVEAESRVLQVSPGQGTIEMRNRWLMDRLATLDYTWDLAARGWLEVGDRIVDHSVPPGTGFTVGANTHSDTAITAFITPAAGQPIGTVIYPKATWTTQQGRTDSRMLRLTLTDRGWHE